jgi:cobalt/nickel transport system ATP-binding protein
MEPQALALDEPTSNLDPGCRREIIKLLKRLETTLIVATHDLEMVCKLCEKVYVDGWGKDCKVWCNKVHLIR